MARSSKKSNATKPDTASDDPVGDASSVDGSAADPISETETATVPPADDTGLTPESEAADQTEAPAGTAADAADIPVAASPVDEGPVEARRGPGFFPLMLGGLVAAVLGFGTAQYLVPEGWPFSVSSDVDQTAILLEEQTRRLDTTREELAELTDTLAAKPDSDALATLGADVDDRLSEILQRLEDADRRFAELQMRIETQIAIPEGAVDTADQLTAFQAQIDTVLAAARAELAAMEEASADAETEARQSAARAAADAAAGTLRAAIASGIPFDGPLSALSATPTLNIPDILTVSAETGVASLVELQESFPDAARAALAASTGPSEGDTPIQRLSGFLRSQTNARSLVPREGDDPDAVLSRAEGLLRDGRINDTLDVLDALPDAGRAEMTDWTASARRRADALAAVEALISSLETN